MANLADMEELLEKISNREVVNYMREASACYGAGAYRGCIVLSYIALFDDMRTKLAELAKINAPAKLIWQEVEKRAGEQDVFESHMADRLKKEGLLTKAEHKQLEIIRDIRNRAAHPSGVQPKPEEARYIYRVVIDDFLGQALLKTTHAADAIVARLTKSNLFPTTDFGEVVEIGRGEIADLNPTADPYLVKELIAARGNPDTTVQTNAGRLLAALARAEPARYRQILRKKLVESLAHDPDYGAWIGRVIVADPSVLQGVSSATPARVQALLSANAKTPPTKIASKLSHPIAQFAAIVSELGEEKTLKAYKGFADTVLEEFPFNPSLLDALVDAPLMRATLVKRWLADAGSSQWDESNPFAAAAPILDDYAETFFTDEEAFRLIVRLIEAADWNGRKAKLLRADQFDALPKTKAKAIAFANKKPKGSLKILEAVNAGATVADFLKDELGAP